MPLTPDDVDVLACPVCRSDLRFEGELRNDQLVGGELRCQECARRWSIRDGLASLYDERRVRGLDRLLRPVYDLIAPFHDLSVDLVLPILQFPDPRATRARYLERLDLERLARERDRRRLRLLEVGIGGGANVPLLEQLLPPDLEVELWGLDLSRGMLEQCRRRLQRHPPRRRVRLLLGDAHALPFPDAAFDRVFHVGAINGYRDRGRALAEMARVARPGTPIVVVDEQLDPGRGHSLFHQIAFRAITLYDRDPHVPRDQLPAGAVDVEVSAVSRFYYCLQFHMPTPRARPVPVARPQKGYPSMATVNDILTPVQLTLFRGAYDPDQMKQLLGAFFPQAYPPSLAYVTAIGDAFFGLLPADNAAPPRAQLSAADRERCLVAILASRGGDLGFAIHIYMALMNGVSPGEVAHILFLNGIYTGVDNFAEGLKVEIAVLEHMKALLPGGQTSPQAVVGALQGTFPR